MKNSSRLTAGEWVQVRSRAEILQTLDETGRLDGLPFMPEMFDFCGKRFRVSKRAHKTCDPVHGLDGRRMPMAVHLEDVRCNGAAHGGCQARCLIFWKDAWLQRVDDGTQSQPEPRAAPNQHRGCTEKVVWSGARKPGEPQDSPDPTYVCQSTQVCYATEHLRWWDPRQYFEDYTSGNAQLHQLLASLVFAVCRELATAGLGVGSLVRGAYDLFQRLCGGTPYPLRSGTIPRGAHTPAARLNIQPGELVRIKDYTKILETLDEDMKNRGMAFDAEMVPFCGGTYTVLDRVTRIVNERTGKIHQLRNDCLLLEDVVCRACYARNRLFCPRSIYIFWREVWLERAAAGRHPAAAAGSQCEPEIVDEQPAPCGTALPS